MAATGSFRLRYISTICTGAALLVLGYFLWDDSKSLLAALEDISLVQLLLLAGLAALVFLLRAEVWHLIVTAGADQLPRSHSYPPSLVAFLVNHLSAYLGSGARIWTLRKFSSSLSPKAGQLAVAELPIVIIEAILVTITLLSVCAFFEVPTWLIIVSVTGTVAGAAALTCVHRRWGHFSTVKGLSILKNRPLFLACLAMTAVVFVIQIIRLWISLDAAGLDPSLFQAVLAFVVIGVLGVLPIGPTNIPAGMMTIFGQNGVGPSAAAGIFYLATSFLAALVCSAGAVLWMISIRYKQKDPPGAV